MENLRLGHFPRGGHQIIGEGSGQKTAVFAIDEFFVERATHCPCEGAVNLPVRDQGIQQGAGIVHGHVFVNPDLAGIAVNFDTAVIEHEGIGQRGIDLILVVGRFKLGWRPRAGFPHARFHFIRQIARGPVGSARGTVEIDRIVSVVGVENLAVCEFQLVCRHIQILARDPRQFGADFLCCHLTGDRGGRRCAACSVAAPNGRCRP